MTRFLATSLDYSRLPAPAVVKGVSYEAIKAARIASLTKRLTDAGIEYDVGALETDPAVILQEEDAYREALDLAAINDAARAVMLPFATGSDLDHLATLFGVARMDGEGDAAFRRRVALAPEAYATAGSPGAYMHHALGVATAVRHVGVSSPAPGVARIVVLGSADGSPTPAALVEAVRARLLRDDVKPLTDEVMVLGAQIERYSINIRLTIPAGPDPERVRALAVDGLKALAADRYAVGAGLDLSAIVGAAYTPNVQRVTVLAPMADIAPSPLAALWCEGVTVTTEIVDG